MKKIITAILALTLTLSMGIPAFAATTSNKTSAKTTYCSNFVDKNGDGICDSSRKHCTKFVDKNGNRVRDNCKKTHHKSCVKNAKHCNNNSKKHNNSKYCK